MQGIAAQMVLNLVEPQSSGIGGGAFMLYWDVAAKTLSSYDGRETAPAGATPELFLDAVGKPLPRPVAMHSGRSVGVPGVLAALKRVHDEYGKLPWAELFQPAIALARDGFPVSQRLAKMLANADPNTFDASARAYFFDETGKPRPPGYTLKNEALAETFETSQGRHERLLQGPIATDIAKSVQNDPRGAGSLSEDDLRRLSRQVSGRPCASPIAATNRVRCRTRPHQAPSPSDRRSAWSRRFDLGTTPMDRQRRAHHLPKPSVSPFADRARYLADPDMVAVPVEAACSTQTISQHGTNSSMPKARPKTLHRAPRRT